MEQEIILVMILASILIVPSYALAVDDMEGGNGGDGGDGGDGGSSEDNTADSGNGGSGGSSEDNSQTFTNEQSNLVPSSGGNEGVASQTDSGTNTDENKDKDEQENKLSEDECKKRGIIAGSSHEINLQEYAECKNIPSDAGGDHDFSGEYIGGYITGCKDSKTMDQCLKELQPITNWEAAISK